MATQVSRRLRRDSKTKIGEIESLLAEIPFSVLSLSVSRGCSTEDAAVAIWPSSPVPDLNSLRRPIDISRWQSRPRSRRSNSVGSWNRHGGGGYCSYLAFRSTLRWRRRRSSRAVGTSAATAVVNNPSVSSASDEIVVGGDGLKI
ncbi:hypothetical protein TIFTF001_005494 [Ficus carica]|uniref:Uncharacterized protein n=1 Tax=Ficus carica TaxID=3494 RepID=A0AA88DET3_FICCA|nr:hypothetical protein TIFTF001_005494 [Ficus carica]